MNNFPKSKAGVKPYSNTIKLGLLNLMPKKVKTENDFITIFSDYETQVEIILLKFDSYTPSSKNVNLDHYHTHYFSINDKLDEIDALIITGAPVEEMPFEEVKYWEEMQTLFEFLKLKKLPTYFICWAAQAALFHYYSIEKELTAYKIFDVYDYQVLYTQCKILKNIEQPIYFPASRHTESNIEKIKANQNLEIVLKNQSHGGLFLIEDKSLPFYYTFGHAEYETDDLKLEYQRDLLIGRKDIVKPQNYNVQEPKNIWKEKSKTLFHNWLREILHTTNLKNLH